MNVGGFTSLLWMFDRKSVHGIAQTFGLTNMSFVYFIVWRDKVNEQGIEYM